MTDADTLMTHEEHDAVDDMIAVAIEEVCMRAGGEHEDPPPRWVREAFKRAGLKIEPLERAGAQPMDDPVARCETCRFYICFSSESEYGKCHRSAPSTQFLELVPNGKDLGHLAIWPEVEGAEDWCGEWKPLEAARRDTAVGQGGEVAP